MMPLSMLNVGEKREIIKINGRDKTRSFLKGLGFVEGAEVTVISEISGNIIVNIMETRVAIDKAMASRIMV